MKHNTMNKAQQLALFNLFCRDHPSIAYSFPGWLKSYRKFRRQFRFAYGDYFFGPYCGMFVGIEHDGYTHS